MRVEIQASSEPLVLPAAVDLAALRIVQEAVSNVRTHANAAHCTVALAKRDGELQVTVSDDGIGPPPTIQSGLGLASIQQRATELGGSAIFMSAPGGGMRVAVRLPIPDPAQ